MEMIMPIPQVMIFTAKMVHQYVSTLLWTSIYRTMYHGPCCDGRWGVRRTTHHRRTRGDELTWYVQAESKPRSRAMRSIFVKSSLFLTCTRLFCSHSSTGRNFTVKAYTVRLLIRLRRRVCML